MSRRCVREVASGSAGRVACCLALVTSVLAIGMIPAASATPASPDATIPTYQWPEAHGDPRLTGLSGDPSINTTNAARLGVRWMVNMGAQSLSSPVVAYNQTLGQTVVYAGTEGGWFTAYSELTGKTLWSVNIGTPIRSTPIVHGSSVWVVGTYSPRLLKLDAATGAQQCSTGPIYALGEASPVIATPPGGQPTIFMGSVDLAQNGPVYAFHLADCSLAWQNAPYPVGGGVWDFMSYAVDAPTTAFPNGEPLVLFGTSDPDGEMYALDATNGALVWRFQTAAVNNDSDVGAGIAISAPGVNGFADGVAYTSGKDGITYAVNLTTGAQIWNYVFENPEVANGSRSTPALAGNQLVIGTSEGTFDLNATTGAVNWHYALPAGDENLGAVAIEGPPSQRVVLTTNLYGQFQVLSLATGALLYSYQTGSYIGSGPAVVDRNILVTSADGFLYDFAVGGATSGSPTTAVTSPVANSTIVNPGQLTISGTASAPVGVSQVRVLVQEDGESGTWWSAADDTWEPGPFNDPATLTNPGATSTTWSLKVPMPARGTILEVWSSAVDANGISDIHADSTTPTASRTTFTILPSTTAPTLEASVPRVAPGAGLTVTGGGYQPGEHVAIDLVTPVVTQLATVVATAQGMIPSSAVTIPTTADFGPTGLTAQGLTSGNTGGTSVIISNNWSQFGDTASRTGTESNDNNIVTNVAVDGRYFFDLLYNFPADAPINTSPAVDSGMAFFGDDNGSLYAVNVHSGAPVWQNSYPSGIDSSPAVDGGAVFFGTLGNTVKAVNELTGAGIWSTPTSSAVETAPAVSGGSVYVGTDDGTFYSLDEKTGAVQWSTKLSAAIHSSPAVDPAHSTVVVGDRSGHVTALATATGTPVWSTLTGGPVNATPMVDNGEVYVGSLDHSEYALNGATGAVQWTYQTQGPIVSNTILLGTRIAVGSEDGTLYYLKSTTGEVINTYSADSPILGLAGSPRIVVATLQNGQAVGNRIGGQETTWKSYGDGTALATAPVVNNGDVFITGLDGNLYVFGTPGKPAY
jgi:outer membrane protein assembly factor BamB